MRLEAVGKRYGLRQPWVVRDVSQEVAAGRLVRLEGPNGSGKSTLLRVLAGVSMPSAGRVTGRPRTGYMPERFPGGLAFSAREYLGHMSRIHGLTGPAAAAAVAEWLERLGATEYAGSPLRTLSKGMCQKVAIAQALLARPGLLVLDEAWTGLDQAARGALDAAVIERLAEGGRVLFVDHDPARLASQVDERWQLSAGHVTVTAGGAQASGAASAGDRDAPQAGNGAVTIEVTGLEAASLAQLARLPGVLSADSGLTGGEGRCDRPGPVQVVVLAAESDSLLRHLLSWDGVHVRAVRPGPEAVRPGLEAGRPGLEAGRPGLEAGP
jgi:ABC-2 type transport system ATP-binding protein